MTSSKVQIAGLISEETKVRYDNESAAEVKLGFVILVNGCTQREAIEAFIEDVTEFVEQYREKREFNAPGVE